MSDKSLPLHFDFAHRDRYRSIARYNLVLAVVALILLCSVLLLSWIRPLPNYYATSVDGKVMALRPLSAPVITNYSLLQWSALTVRSAFNLDFLRYTQQLATMQSHFTAAGWSNFMKALEDSGLLDNIKNKKLQVTAVTAAAPVIVSTGVISGRFTWRIQVPILVTFTSASDTANLRWLVTMNVQRSDTLEAYEGVQISDFSVGRQN